MPQPDSRRKKSRRSSNSRWTSFRQSWTVKILRCRQPERKNSSFRANSSSIHLGIAPRACGLTDAFTGWSDVMKFGNAYNNFIRFTVAETSTILVGNQHAPALANPYPGPCNGNVGETGDRGTPEQQVTH